MNCGKEKCVDGEVFIYFDLPERRKTERNSNAGRSESEFKKNTDVIVSWLRRLSLFIQLDNIRRVKRMNTVE